MFDFEVLMAVYVAAFLHHAPWITMDNFSMNNVLLGDVNVLSVAIVLSHSYPSVSSIAELNDQSERLMHQ